MKKPGQIKGIIILLITAAIWGSAFVFQEEATKQLGSFTINAVRFLIGSLVILPLTALPEKDTETNEKKVTVPKYLILGGIVCGIFLSLGANLQNLGIQFNAEITSGSSGKAAFISSLYIVIVPIFALVLHRKPSAGVFVALVVAVLGLYLISVKEGFTIDKGDIFIIACAFAFALQITSIDIFLPKVNCIALSSAQFFVTGVTSLILALIFEHPDINSILAAAVPLLYLGVMSSGGAYTLQIVGQKFCEVSVASIVMGLESVFGMLAACVYYLKLPTLREAIGCLLMFAAIMMAQTPFVDNLLNGIRRKSRKNA